MKKKLWKDEEKRDSVYRDLAPINSIKPEEESIRALRWAIKNPNVHNIALSGPYGSGKSSVIQSYLAYYDIPFSADILKELKEMSQQLWLNYIKNYKEKFLDDIAVSEIDLDDVKSLIRSDIFSGKEVKNILGEIDVTKIDVELSKMLLVFSEEVIFEKTYVEAVWEELPEENRYRWLYNQMDAYNLDELAEHFAQLEATYHQFAQRTQHKYKVHNNEFNMQLCEKLKRRGFLTSVNYKGKWIEGYVKKAV